MVHEVVSSVLEPCSIEPLERLKGRVLHGGVGEDAEHLSAISFVQGEKALALHNAHEGLIDAVVGISTTVDLDEDFDAIDWRHQGLGQASSDSYSTIIEKWKQ